MSRANNQRRVKLRFINWLNSHDRTRDSRISLSRFYEAHDKSRLLREKNLLRFTCATIFDTSLIPTRGNQKISRWPFLCLNGMSTVVLSIAKFLAENCKENTLKIDNNVNLSSKIKQINWKHIILLRWSLASNKLLILISFVYYVLQF